jgi:hypothetical protein
MGRKAHRSPGSKKIPAHEVMHFDFAPSPNPPGNVTEMPPSSASASSAVTIKSGRQRKPLEREWFD